LVRQILRRDTRRTTPITPQAPSRVETLQTQGYTKSNEKLFSPTSQFLRNSWRRMSQADRQAQMKNYNKHEIILDSKGRIKKEIFNEVVLAERSSSGAWSVYAVKPKTIKVYDYVKGVVNTTIRDNRSQTFRHVATSLPRTSVKSSSIPSTSRTSVKKNIEGGRTQTVSRKGTVTIRDSRGNFISRYSADPIDTKQFIQSTSASTQKKIADKIRAKETQKGINAFFKNQNANLKRLEGSTRVSTAHPTIKVFKDSKGRIVGVQDSVTKKSYRVTPGDVSIAQIAFIEGIRETHKYIQQESRSRT